MEPQLHEIVDLERVDTVIVLIAVAAPVLGLLIGALWGRARKAMETGVTRGLAFGLLGPVVLVMWRVYKYMVRYDPESGYVGLHKISVLLINVALFALVGVLLGVIYGKLLGPHRRPLHEEAQDRPENEES